MAATKYIYVNGLADAKARKRARAKIRKGMDELTAVREEAGKLVKQLIREETGGRELVLDFSDPGFKAQLGRIGEIIDQVEAAIFR